MARARPPPRGRSVRPAPSGAGADAAPGRTRHRAGGALGELDGNAYASIVGALNVGLAYWLLLGWGVAPSPRRWLTIGFAFTTHWWVAGMAGPHHYAQLCGVLFTLLALNLAVRGRGPLGGGLLLGLAAGHGSRRPWPFRRGRALRRRSGRRRRIGREHAWLVAGVACRRWRWRSTTSPASARPSTSATPTSPRARPASITDEPYFSEGLLSVSYIPRHLQGHLPRCLRRRGRGALAPSILSGTSLMLTAPFLFLAVLARGRYAEPCLWLGVVLVMLPKGMSPTGVMGLRAVRLPLHPGRRAAAAAPAGPRVSGARRRGCWIARKSSSAWSSMPTGSG